MPSRTVIARELAQILAVLSHPDRLRIITELRHGERDVNSLQAELGVSHSRVSQHLSNLKAHRLVAERRDGRHVYYHLIQPALAHWLLQGLEFLEGEFEMNERLRKAVQEARTLWGTDGENRPEGDAEPAG